MLFRWALFVFLALTSVALFYSTAQNTSTASSLADQALESTALGLAAAAENELRTGEEVRKVLSDRVVAYALIAGADGEIFFHTNPALVGTKLSDQALSAWFESRRTTGRRVTLGTGLPGFEFQYPIRPSAGPTQMLRLVLHTVEVDRIAAQARRLWWVSGVVVTSLWSVGFALERAFVRQTRLQEESLRREKLALIGQMTAALAHEIRNALGSIKGFAQWADEKIADDDSLKPAMAAVLQGSGRIERLVGELLAYSRDETYRGASVAIARVLRDALAESRGNWGGEVEVVSVEELRAWADEEKLRRVLANGILNAIEAMGETGLLRLTAADLGRQVEIQIQDSGEGVSPESADRVFTPFFTTKATGTGLGLAYSRKVVEGMGGTIELANRKGGGATLSLLLPKPGSRACPSAS